MTTLVPCDLHEITNCSVCTGADKRFQRSLEDPLPDPDAPVPYIPGGITMHAKFDGNCAGCGRRYPVGTIIHRPHELGEWYSIECCLQ